MIIKKILFSLDASKITGIDKIPAKFLMDGAVSRLIYPFTDIHQSLSDELTSLLPSLKQGREHN